MFKTLISPNQLVNHLEDLDWAVVDCRFYLEDPEQGHRAYQQNHIPGAVYAHLDHDLSGEVIQGVTGRHPLPSVKEISNKFSTWGIDQNTQVVAYDDKGGMIAARLWWMLRWMGHSAVAVLDGGWQAWLELGCPTKSGIETRERREFRPYPDPERIAVTNQVTAMVRKPGSKLIDSRSPERFRGESEPYDPVPGHIPGAVNAPHTETVDSRGYFLSPEKLRGHFERVLGETPSEEAVFYCGSGVTAARNILALVHAGMDESMLYVGSWSEWIQDPKRPVEKN